MAIKKGKLILATGTLVGAFAALSYFSEDDAPAPAAPPQPAAVAMTTLVDANIYGQNNVMLGVLDKGSCVVAPQPFQDDASGFRNVSVYANDGATISGTVAARLLSAQNAGTIENCKAAIRQVFADPSKPVTPETRDLPMAQTYLVTSRIPVFFGPDEPPSGLFLEANSCVAILSDGHSDSMFHVMISDPKRMGDAYVYKGALTPQGTYDWDKGCNAILSGTAVNKRPAAAPAVTVTPVTPSETTATTPVIPVPKERPTELATPTAPAETTAAPQPPEIRNGRLYIVTADQLNLRAGPGPHYGRLNTLFRDSCVQALGTARNENGFVQVLTSYDQRTYEKGFVAQDHLKPAPHGLGKMECFIK